MYGLVVLITTIYGLIYYVLSVVGDDRACLYGVKSILACRSK